MQVVCRSLPELEYPLFFLFPSPVTRLKFLISSPKLNLVINAKGMKFRRRRRQGLHLTAVVLLAVVSQNRQYRKASKLSLTLPPYTSTNARSPALIKSSFFNELA